MITLAIALTCALVVLFLLILDVYKIKKVLHDFLETEATVTALTRNQMVKVYKRLDLLDKKTDVLAQILEVQNNELFRS